MELFMCLLSGCTCLAAGVAGSVAYYQTGGGAWVFVAAVFLYAAWRNFREISELSDPGE